MRATILIVLILFYFNVYSQGYANKEYYLVDSLNLNELSVHDLAVLDSSLKLFHESEHDTAKILALNIVCEELLNNQWSKYQFYQYELISKLAKKQPDFRQWTKKHEASALTNLAYLNFYEYGDNEKGLKFLNKSVAIQKSINDLKGLATSYTNLGFIYNVQGDVKKALNYQYKSLSIREKLHDKKGIAYSYNNIGSIYYVLDNLDKALEFYLKAKEIRVEIKDKKGVANSYSRIAKIYHKKGLFSEALKYFEKSLMLHEGLGYKLGMAPTLKNIGMVYISLGETKKARNYLTKSLTLSEEINYKDGVAGSLHGLAKVSFLLNDINAAKINANKAFELFEELNSLTELVTTVKLLAEIHEKDNNLNLALKYQKLYSNLNDSLTKISRQKEVLEKEFEYEYDKKLISEQIEFERKLGEDKLKRLNERYTILSLIAIIAIVIGLFIRSRYFKNLREREKLLHEIELLKEKSLTKIITAEERTKIALNKDKIEAEIDAKLNETDWKILNILFNDPIVANKEIADQVALSIEGTSSSLRKMYRLFNLDDSKNKKLALVVEITRISGKI